MLADFSIVPIGIGESLSSIVAEAIEIVRQSGLPYRLTPMGTVVEGEWDEVVPVVRACHERVLDLAPRALTTLRIDDRKGKVGAIESKVLSVEDKLGETVSKY